MNAKIVGGRIGSLPAFGTVTNLESGDITQIIGATTGLVKTLGKYALVGGLATLGIGSIFLALLLAGMAPAPEPTIPLGCTPNFIRTGKRSFWGILLDDELEFEAEGNTLKVPFDFVRKFGTENGFTGINMKVGLVDGSQFKDVRLIAPTEFRLATLAGIQKLPFTLDQQPHTFADGVRYNEWASFESPTVTEVKQLRSQLRQALDQNAAAITKLIGSDILQQYFNIPQI